MNLENKEDVLLEKKEGKIFIVQEKLLKYYTKNL
jgi:hypothetical protein